MSDLRDHGGEHVLVARLDGHCHDTSLLGGKGAALDRLIAWGLRIPPTAVVTANAFRMVWAQASLAELRARLGGSCPPTDDEIDAAFVEAGLPAVVRDPLIESAAQIGEGATLAVRSSATVEDMARSSFAGQYRSLLHVDPVDPHAVEHAVLSVFASLFHAAPRAYRAALGINEEGAAMAAVVMRMVDAQRAGVIFTIDPTLLEPTIRLEVVDGIGESLVSGKRTPRIEHYGRFTDADGAVRAHRAARVDNGLAAAVDAALEIERLAGCAQDIEWAEDATGLWVVQARPVTTARTASADQFDDDPSTLAPSEFTTEGIAEMLPGVLPPLVWCVASHVVEEGFRTMLARLGADLSEAENRLWLLRRIRGRAALDVSRLGLLMDRIPGGNERVRAAYFGLERTRSNNNDDDNNNNNGSDSGSDNGSPDGSPIARRASVGPSQTARIAHAIRAASARRTALFDADMVVAAIGELTRQQVRSTPTDLSSLGDHELLQRHSSLVRLAVRAMAAELTLSADAGAIHTSLCALLVRYLGDQAATRWANEATVPAHRVSVSSSASAAVFAGPSWSELGLAPPSPRDPFDREVVFARLSVALAQSARWPAPGLRRRLVRRRIEHLVLRAAEQFEYRELTKAAILGVGGHVRALHVEMAQRLVARGALESVDDIALLSPAELGRLLGSGLLPEGLLLANRRRLLDGHHTHEPLPAHWHGIPPAEGAVRPDSQVLSGWAASDGRFIGRARRVDSAQGTIEPTEVLIATATDPSWSPLLLRCGALVLERGGPLSHAAILAREFGVPAVFNVPGAASLLDGKRLLVDGDVGTVTILGEDGNP